MSSIFGKQYHTVHAIIEIYKKEDKFKQKRKGGQRNKKLVEEQIQMIQSGLMKTVDKHWKASKSGYYTFSSSNWELSKSNLE